MNLLQIIDMLCDITTRQSDLLKELVTDLEHMDQVAPEVKKYYRNTLDGIEADLDITEYGCRRVPDMDRAVKDISK